MASSPVTPDRWTILDDRLRFYLASDPLMVGGFRPSVDYGINPAEEFLEVRTRAPMPAGWRLQFHYRGLALPARVLDEELDPVDTGQFRSSPIDEPARLIDPDQVLRARRGRW